MTRLDRADVAVIGGGPAGSVTAMLLARTGASVVLFERSWYDALRLGETLPPSVNPLLRDLGLWDRFRALRLEPSYQTASAWGGDEPADRSFIFSPHGNGWHVDRARFDEMLALAAADAGVRLLRGATVRGVTRTDGGLLVEAVASIHVRAIVDATGRPARIARSLGALRDRLDRLVCAARVFNVGDQPTGDTFVEATPNGWWYASPLPEAHRLIAVFSDAGHAARARLARTEGWGAALAHTNHVRRLASGCPADKVHVAGCASHELRPVAGPGWIAVGDAALAVDPLSSGGVAFALRSAVEAAGALLEADRSRYEDFVVTSAREYRRLRSRIYGWEQRFRDRDFWRVRAEEQTSRS